MLNKHLVGGILLGAMYAVFVLLVILSLSINNFRLELKSQIINAKEYLQNDMLIDHLCNISSIASAFNSTANRSDKIEPQAQIQYLPELIEIPCIRRPDSVVDKLTAFDVLLDHKERLDNISNMINIENATQKEEIARLSKDASDDPMLPELISGTIKRHQDKVSTLKQEYRLWEDHQQNINTIIKESKFLNYFGISEDSQFWATNPILLSLILMMAMGGLGSMITLTSEHLATPRNQYKHAQLSKYIFRPMLGTIVALAMYITLKSGQISVTGESDGEFSPFYLSFFGVLSGLMSERIYERIIELGNGVLNEKA